MPSLDELLRPPSKQRPQDRAPDLRGIIPYRSNDIIRQRIRTYLAFVSSVRRRNYFINADGNLIETDYDGFIRNRQYVSTSFEQYYHFHADDMEFLLRQGWLFAHQDVTANYLDVKVWDADVRDMPQAFEVLIELAHKLDRRSVRIQYVTGFDHGKPRGRTDNLSLDQFEQKFRRENDKVSWL